MNWRGYIFVSVRNGRKVLFKVLQSFRIETFYSIDQGMEQLKPCPIWITSGFYDAYIFKIRTRKSSEHLNWSTVRKVH